MSRLSAFRVYATLLALGVSLEACSYPRPGNVHRLSDLDDMRLEDFVITGHVAQWCLYEGVLRGYRGAFRFGDLIYEIVKTSKRLHGGGNTCLGTSILLVPMSLSIGYLLRRGERIGAREVTTCATRLLMRWSTVEDSIYFYKAVRTAAPSYVRAWNPLPRLPDVFDEGFSEQLRARGLTLWRLLDACSAIDIVCREVVEMYPLTLKALSVLRGEVERSGSLNEAVVKTYMSLLSEVLDTMVLRKLGLERALEVRRKARAALSCGSDILSAAQELDAELRRDGINPGSIADVVAACLSLYFVERGERLVR